jgi:hypothetical protein
MSRDWETQFREWAKPPGKTEQERCDNAISAIRNAIKSSETLRDLNLSIFSQGSYRNNTNVRRDSDVDIGILCSQPFFVDPLPEGLTDKGLGLYDVNYSYSKFRSDVEKALKIYFANSAVQRGNKAFDVHETSYHVEADVAAFFEHRRYREDGSYISGVELRTDRGNNRIINWPEQHYQNGVEKNNSTGRRYKSIVRVLKARSYEMTGNGNRSGDIPGFLIECLVWNTPDEYFQHDTYSEDLRETIKVLYNRTKQDSFCSEWGEVSELKYLFRPNKGWTRKQANEFTVAAWNYAGFGDQ